MGGTGSSYLARAGGCARPGCMDSVFVEIRAAEGGADAKLLVREQLSVYTKYMALEGL